MKVASKVIVVTGAGSGMGRELTLQLLAKGACIAAVDISENSLTETKQMAGDYAIRLSTHLLNVADRHACANFPEVVIAAHGAVDGLINNAGIIQPFIPINELTYETIDRIMQINFMGTVQLTKAFLPHLLQRPEAHIANVSSMGGFIPFPGQSFYGASKAAVKLFTEALYAELQGTQVGVSIIFPGAVNTNIMANSGLEQPKATAAQASRTLPADKAAAIMIQSIEKKQLRILVGSDAQLLDKLYRFNPAWAIRFIAKQMKKMGR